MGTMKDYIVIGPSMAVNPGITIGLRGKRVKDRLFALKKKRDGAYEVQKTFHLKYGEEFSTDHKVSSKMAEPKDAENSREKEAELAVKVDAFLDGLPKLKDDIVEAVKKAFPDLALSDQDTIAEIKEQAKKHALRNPGLIKKLKVNGG